MLGITIVDYNDDGWPDILVANDLTPSLLFANQGNGTFRELGAQTGLVLDEGGVAYAGMGIDAAYINNDAQLCVAIGNFTGQPTTLHCQARVDGSVRPDVFIEQSHRAGIAAPTLRMVTFGLFFFDADLDGWQTSSWSMAMWPMKSTCATCPTRSRHSCSGIAVTAPSRSCSQDPTAGSPDPSLGAARPMPTMTTTATSTCC